MPQHPRLRNKNENQCLSHRYGYQDYASFYTNEHVYQVERIPKSLKFWKDLSFNQKKTLHGRFILTVIHYYCLHAAIARGKQAFEKYLATREPIPYYLRQWCRRESSFMPMVATYSRELALMCLTTRVRNIICHYHSRHTSSKYSNDHALSDKRPHIKVTGVAYPRTAVSKQVKEEDDEDEDDNDDHGTGSEVKAGMALHCGCWTDDALLDFFLWKTTTIQSPSTQVSDRWREDILEPRQRAFVTTAFKEYSGLKVDNLYNYNSEGKVQNTPKLLRAQLAHIIDHSMDGLNAAAFKKRHNI